VTPTDWAAVAVAVVVGLVLLTIFYGMRDHPP
jgi:hypothetical protein